MTTKSGRVGITVAAPFIALAAGIPVLAGVFVESWVIAGIFGWDTLTVFLVQAVPMTVTAVIYAVIAAASGEFNR